MSNSEVITILFAGAAGDGVKEAGRNLSKLLLECGQEVFLSFEYQSLIRGGHNFCRLSFSAEKIFSDRSVVDLLVAFNGDDQKPHQQNLAHGGIIIDDKNLPMTEIVKTARLPVVMRSAVVLGAMCYYLALPVKKLERIFIETFEGKADDNIRLARIGFDYARKNHWPLRPIKIFRNRPIRLCDGNQALSEGMLAAGLKVYAAYPMTPATSILHFLALHQNKYGVKVVQPESEIAAANIALGAAYAGARAAVGTSGGGFALMQEAVSLSGMSETPFVCAVSQRPGPATGMPTGTAQSDLLFVLHAGHGEFPRVVLAPGDVAESYEAGALAVNLAWRYQIPAIVLLDKHLSESSATITPFKKIKASAPKLFSGNAYERYKITNDGISPIVFPGSKGIVVKANSYEHDSAGMVSEDGKTVLSMTNKRLRKIKGLEKEMNRSAAVKVFGDKKSLQVVLFWGSTKGAVLEAIRELKNPPRAIQVLWLSPFPVIALKHALRGAKNIVCVEENATGQLASLVREKIGVSVNQKILKYDGRAFTVDELKKIWN